MDNQTSFPDNLSGGSLLGTVVAIALLRLEVSVDVEISGTKFSIKQSRTNSVRPWYGVPYGSITRKIFFGE